jgi:acyl-CoA reductase-like NAD-dependent aldehyde dehydrogenase
MTGLYKETHNPATGQVLGRAADGETSDVNAAVEAAQLGFRFVI